MPISKALTSYLSKLQESKNEAAKVNLFTALLTELYGLSSHMLGDYLSGIETPLRHKKNGAILRGRADNLFGNIVIEFEKDLSKTREHAKEQVINYLEMIWSTEGNNKFPYIGMISDGKVFETFTPFLNAEGTFSLQIIEKIDWSDASHNEIMDWLDRFFVRKQLIVPSSLSFVKDFGANSHAFSSTTSILDDLWSSKKHLSRFDVLFQNWNRYLAVVYGKEIGDSSLFIRHTYLAIVAKLLSWKVVTGRTDRPDDSELRDLITGKFFQDAGILNFVDEDFFAWIARDEVWKSALLMVRRLYSSIINYDLSKLSEDILKEIYQNLVDPKTRKYLGEFYTPDWLADEIVHKTLSSNPSSSVLDPSCGSGTFVYLSIRAKKFFARKIPEKNLLRHITENVYGIDVHPLAVIIARTNYLLALGDLLVKRKSAISIPVYLADSIRLPDQYLGSDQLEFKLEDQILHVSEHLIKRNDYDRVIQLIAECVHDAFKRKVNFKEEDLISYVQRNLEKKLTTEQTKSVQQIAITLKYFLDIDRNSIWAFVLKNIYKPSAMRSKFDLVLGNPPWITYKELDPQYQEFVKDCVKNHYHLLESSKVRLMPQLELATLFTVRCADIYLKSGGEIAFVLPRSFLVADQHSALRANNFVLAQSTGCKLKWNEVWDCENVKPLFNVPTCVVVGQKMSVKDYEKNMHNAPAAKVLNGSLSTRNPSRLEAAKTLTFSDGELIRENAGKRIVWSISSKGHKALKKDVLENPYRNLFKQGATILPRRFWFVTSHKNSSKLGMDKRNPNVVSDEKVPAKHPYSEMIIKGKIESQFIFNSFLTTDVVPFALTNTRQCVLPLVIEKKQSLLDANSAREKGFNNLAEWITKVEEFWSSARGDKIASMTSLQRLDFQRTLTNQSLKTTYAVIYNAGGKHLTSAVVKRKTQDTYIVIDHKFYFYETSDANEAYYLSAILNSPWLSGNVNRIQTTGNFGERDIHTRPLEFYFAKFDPSNIDHQLIANLAKQGESIMKKQNSVETAKLDSNVINFKNYLSTAGRRKNARESLQALIQEIDGVCRKLFDVSQRKAI